MKVSVVIPCWRQARFLPVSAGSALAQTHPGVETIVVNDGSDDDTAAVAANLGPRVRYVAKPNGGLASARNAGLAAATGDACLFLDADDALAPEAIEWLVAAGGGGGASLAVMGYRTFRDSPSEAGGVERAPAAGPAFPRLLHDNLGPPNAWLAPAALLRSIGGFDEAMPRGCEDWDAWTRLVLAGAELRAVPRIGALYRDAAGSMSKDLALMLRSRAAVLLKAHAAIASDDSLRREFAADLLAAERRVLRRVLAQELGDAELVRRLTEAMSDLTAAGFRDPASPRERFERALFGAAAEHVHVAFCRLFRRNWIEFWRAGYV